MSNFVVKLQAASLDIKIAVQKYKASFVEDPITIQGDLHRYHHLCTAEGYITCINLQNWYEDVRWRELVVTYVLFTKWNSTQEKKDFQERTPNWQFKKNWNEHNDNIYIEHNTNTNYTTSPWPRPSFNLRWICTCIHLQLQLIDDSGWLREILALDLRLAFLKAFETLALSWVARANSATDNKAK